MPRLLRVVRKAKWYKHPGVPWLAEDDLQADSLLDLKTDDNVLSVWHIEDDESNLGRVVAALAAKRNNVANFDYALIDADLVVNLPVHIKNKSGDTPDAEANQKWHRDLTQLTHRQLFELANLIRRHGKVERIQHPQVLESLKKAYDADQLEHQKIDPKLLPRLRENPLN